MSIESPIAKNAYIAFDGLSIKEKIQERLRQTAIFTDQNAEGSNLSALNDMLGMIGSLLIYNVNKSSVNGQFTMANLYESMNGIVKEIGYSPIGHQTASLVFGLDTVNLNAGSYTIPRFSSISVGGYKYSLADNLAFTRISDAGTSESLVTAGESSILYQGEFIEYPTQIAAGNDNEILVINTDANTIVDNFNIVVFVKSSNSPWKEWQKVNSAYLYNTSDEIYEVRFNEKKKYEIKFGNNINGKKLTAGDQVAIYYLKSNGTSGEVGANVLNGKKLIKYNSSKYNTIISDVYDVNFITSTDLQYLNSSNTYPSSYYTAPETVEQIRANAPSNFRSQFSLTTERSYSTFIRTNFSNIIHDVHTMNNETFVDSYTKYFYNLGLTKPQLENRALFNQVRFADSCNFNNIYCFTVPKTINNTLSYISPEQKSLIISTMKGENINIGSYNK